jgi:hypothetical protein
MRCAIIETMIARRTKNFQDRPATRRRPDAETDRERLIEPEADASSGRAPQRLIGVGFALQRSGIRSRGTFIAERPRSDPYGRDSRIRLPPRVFDAEAVRRPRMEDLGGGSHSRARLSILSHVVTSFWLPLRGAAPVLWIKTCHDGPNSRPDNSCVNPTGRRDVARASCAQETLLFQIPAALERRGATRRRYCRSSFANVRRSRSVRPAGEI